MVLWLLFCCSLLDEDGILRALEEREVQTVTLQDIIKGESRNVEFTVELPKKSEKYMKSMITFSNTSGGKIVI